VDVYKEFGRKRREASPGEVTVVAAVTWKDLGRIKVQLINKKGGP